MAEIKSAQADSFVEKPDQAFRTILLYGPDGGLVSERADMLSTKYGVELSDPFSLVRMDADTAAADKSRLADEAHTIGMFGGNRLIRISGSTRRNLADAVKPVLDTPPQDCWIIIEAGDLKKDSALRRQVEKSKSGVAIPCYQDDDKAIDRLITSQLQAAGIAMEPEARVALRGNLGSDRRASRNEIEKLLLYCAGQKSITAADVTAIIGDTASLATDDLVDAAMDGDTARLEDLSGRIAGSGASPDMIVIQALRQFQALQAMRHRMERTRAPAAAVIQSVRPPIHFSRRNLMERALRNWDMPRIERALQRLDQASLEARANSALGWAIAGRALLGVAAEAKRGSRG